MKRIEDELIKGIWALPSFPVVLVTVGHNIMTAGAFHFYSFDPPCVMVGIIHDKYTNELMNQYNEFGINIPTVDQIEIVHICGSKSGKGGENKYSLAGITPMSGVKIKSSLIKECPLNLECKVVHKIDFPGSHQWFVGEVKAVHKDENYSRDQALMFWGGEYRKVGEFLENS
ncbi:MAG: flavin reductase family protein [Anaerolineaceae bacterium]|nr:flavin reductase family protein [Anaerolineaceae bacterium]